MFNFEDRKRDHIEISLSSQSQTQGASGLDRIELIHEALPELNFSDIQIHTNCFGVELKSPLFVSSMTLGHDSALAINDVIASACVERGWMMGVGSQRRQLEDNKAYKECQELRRRHPQAIILGNLGLSQLIQTPIEKVQELVDSLEAQAMIIHTNPLQECIQPEGTPQFKGGLEAISNLCTKLSVPVVLKETGCGFSQKTFLKLIETGLAAVDVSGKGGTHWGRVESMRIKADDVRYQAGQSFANWGLSTVDSVLAAKEAHFDMNKIWASGGVRSGLDAAKLLALGASMVGFAKPILEAALESEKTLHSFMESLEYELSVAMFCMGISNLEGFKQQGLWKWM